MGEVMLEWANGGSERTFNQSAANRWNEPIVQSAAGRIEVYKKHIAAISLAITVSQRFDSSRLLQWKTGSMAVRSNWIALMERLALLCFIKSLIKRVGAAEVVAHHFGRTCRIIGLKKINHTLVLEQRRFFASGPKQKRLIVFK